MRCVIARGVWFALAMLWLTSCSSTPYAAATPNTGAFSKIAPVLLNAVQQLQSGTAQLPLTGPVRSDSRGRIQVYVYVTSTSGETVTSLQKCGLQNLVVSPEMHVVQGWVKPKDLVNLAALPVVARITLPQYGRSR
jgi:hypothetical protein